MPVTATAAAEPHRPSGAWVWRAEDWATPAALVDAATANGIDELFVHVRPGQTDPAAWAPLRRAADAAGVRLSALGGDPSWTNNHDAVLAWVDQVVRLGVFEGVHLDVEPYQLPGWRTRQARVIRSYLEMLDAVVARAGALPVEADIPFWFDEYAATGAANLAEAVLQRVSAVTVMTYRDEAGTGSADDRIIWHGRAEVAVGERLGKGVRLAVESRDAGLDKVDFSAEGRAALELAVGAVDAFYAGSPAYAGVAVHDLAGYLALH